MALDALVDQHLDLADLWGGRATGLADAVARAGSPERALAVLQAQLPRSAVDPLVRAAVRLLMPWRPVDIDYLAAHLALSPRQLRRRCLQAVGVARRPSSGSCGSRASSRWPRRAPRARPASPPTPGTPIRPT
ncbi:hypothetical protein AB0M80_03660 [Amycolatopsis sp. NPDC051045]|uniref:hypothetical protein n=1 Tax=Amycolatopsis sp. NPDC051045 TaxID=3156922 RepID=UPI00342330C2